MFVEPFGDDVPIDEDNLQTDFEMELDSKDEIEPLPTSDDDGMED